MGLAQRGFPRQGIKTALAGVYLHSDGRAGQLCRGAQYPADQWADGQYPGIGTAAVQYRRGRAKLVRDTDAAIGGRALFAAITTGRVQ